MQAKICSSCGLMKALEDFHKDRNRPDGRRSACKDCRSQKNSRPERAALPPIEPPPVDEDKLKTLARSRAIREVVESHWAEFNRRYRFHFDQLDLQRKWHHKNED
jgi:hypothetical protein